MAPHSGTSSDESTTNNLTAVTIDRDKNSASAVKWAVEHLLLTDHSIILIHVKIRNPQPRRYPLFLAYDTYGEVANAYNASGSTDEQQLFKPSRLYCARKGIKVKEVLLEGVDVSKAILDYISDNHIKNIVLGASSRNPIARKFWTHDVPTIVNKAAPDFCSVYVIAKGKKLSFRPAVRSKSTPVTPKQESARNQSPIRFNHSEPEDLSRALSRREEQKGVGPAKVWPPAALPFGSMENIDISFVAKSNVPSRNSLSTSDSDSTAPFHFGPMEAIIKNVDFANMLDAANSGSSGSSSLEAEMNRLKLELKQTLEMYNTACKEALSAKQKAKELDRWKMEEALKIEQARHSGESAVAIVEMEKAKRRAAIEAAEKAQKLADIEAQRRKHAEEKAKREAEGKSRALKILSQNDCRCRKYTIEDIEIATNKFSSSSKIGEGGYGPVYKGKLDHTPVAIKILRPDAAQGRKQFQQEVEVLSSIRHPNMVLLLGACPEYGCLVYEYMNYGSLEDRLFRKGNTPPIPWAFRFKIAADIATGLLFLHQTKPEPLVHRDLKPANILLDQNFVCKISDVGLARLVPASVADTVTQYHMTSAAGTFCYIDPEYQHTGELGTKSDIYSLGVLLLQIITARPPMGLTHHVERAIEEGRFADLLDPTVPEWPVEDALSFAKLALQCVELRKKDRPDLGSVIVPELSRLKELGMNSMFNNS
ncbi:U-box domain-containing protein 35 [Coffea eugenioides]|uniref:U-box domain-containing protein 35 n=1 Tax=Coffea eugenioides TaxID=49369 RepID=UPI000F609774|nr:U-box domain-containing protein 35 [Coffea eugenioides]